MTEISPTARGPVYTVFFEGTLKLESPFASCPPTDTKSNVARLPRLPVYRGGAFELVPHVKPAAIRGKIRRAAAEVLRARYEQAGADIKEVDWFLWTVGGVKGNQRETMDVIERAKIIEDSALLAMFGAGASPAGGMVSGTSFRIDPGIPLSTEVGIVSGARGAENLNPALSTFLSPAEMERVQEYTDANAERSKKNNSVKALKAELSKLIRKAGKNGKAATKEDSQALDAKRLEMATAEAEHAELSDHAQEVGSSNAMGRPLAGYEVLPQGLEIPHGLQLVAATEAHIGFILESIAEFALDPVIGAHISSGCGKISADYAVRFRAGRGRVSTQAGTMAFSGRGGLEIQSEFLERCLQAWKDLAFVPDHYRG